MLENHLQQFPKGLWIQIYPDYMQILHPSGEVLTTTHAITPYVHPRSIIGHFEAATATFKQMIQQSSLSHVADNPLCFIQVMSHDEHGLSQVELRVLQELTYQAVMAREVRIYDHQGQHIQHQVFDSSKRASGKQLMFYILILVIGLVGLVMFFSS